MLDSQENYTLLRQTDPPNFSLLYPSQDHEDLSRVQLTGLAPLLRFADYEVVTVIDEVFREHRDEELINHAKANDYIFVTEDDGAAKMANEKKSQVCFSRHSFEGEGG
jgi:uncharacterized protein with PIN domain